jgi:hypothetical protein
VAIEGACPKLRAHSAGQQTVLVVGTYGLDEAGAWTGRQTAHAAQALALVHSMNPADASGARTAEIKPALLEGLPRTPKGWVEGDLEVGGSFPSGVWLERTVRSPAATNKGALFEVSRDGFTWQGSSWRSSAGRDASLRGPHTTLPTASILCGGDEETAALSLLAAERTPDGTTFVAGRCEDGLHRPVGPLLLGRYDVSVHSWQRIEAPPSTIFEGPDAIVNAGIVPVSPNEAWIYAYRPFTEIEKERAYLVHLDVSSSRDARASLVNVPFQRSIVSLARNATDGSLWAVAGFAELHHTTQQDRWDSAPTPLPPLKFVDPVPSSVRLLDVQITGKDVWVHGAVPIVRDDGSAGREHVLYTTAPWSASLHCDRDLAPADALLPTTKRVKLGVLPKHAAPVN